MGTWGYAGQVQAVKVWLICFLGEFVWPLMGWKASSRCVGQHMVIKRAGIVTVLLYSCSRDGGGLPGFQDVVLASSGRASFTFLTALGL